MKRPDTKLGQLVRAKRSVERLTGRQLAEKLGLSRGTILGVENGRGLTRLAADKLAPWLDLSTEVVLRMSKTQVEQEKP